MVRKDIRSYPYKECIIENTNRKNRLSSYAGEKVRPYIHIIEHQAN